ncbi:hypothetical protein CSA37_04575 [Candidatus Fermentibacteria bacterium]|nr:MAG: hypothetical protein CSA37_06925 [Candidatus Fermentibacteria bacterium]PIE52923.1 MAG: hypothetical protein CSA37_04575 [Candidatus Fermentibacteria bacterium]
MSRRIFIAAVLFALLSGCGEQQGETVPSAASDTTVVRTMPETPLEVALQFSNLLGMNDPECIELLAPELKDSVVSTGFSPWEFFGRWRGFDQGGRLTPVLPGPDSLYRTSYYCSIVRLEELPPVIRMDFVLLNGSWFIERIENELTGNAIDSLSVEYQAAVILSNPDLLREMRLAGMLLKDVDLDREVHWSSWHAAEAAGTSFEDYVAGLSQESYSVMALSNVRAAAKLQIVQDRATFQVTDFPVELRELVAAWRELAYLEKAVLRANHEAMQNLRQTGTWMGPDVQEEEERIAFLRSVFFAVDALIEERDTLSRTYPALLTCGSSEPLETLLIYLDPHQLEQKVESDIGIPVWRALGVDMNGDPDPERVVYWAGDIYLFLGTPTGYRLVWRSWKDFQSDFHSQFGTQTGPAGYRSVVLVGNTGQYEYELSLSADGKPLFTRKEIPADSVQVQDDLLIESPLLNGAGN